MYNKKIARRYTLALYEVAKENNILDNIREDFISIKKIIDGSRDFKLFIETPIINPEKKRMILNKIFSGKVNDLTLKFFDILTEKGRENKLNDITMDLFNLINEKEGIIEANIKTAVALNDNDKKALADKLQSFTGKKIEAKYFVNPDIKGGFIAQIDDTIINASIKRQLELLFEEFKKGSFLNN